MKRILLLIGFAAWSGVLVRPASAQICEIGTPHPMGMVAEDAYPASETIWGNYFLNETHGSREGGKSTIGNVDWLIVRDFQGNLRGSAPVDDNGYYLVTVFGFENEKLSDLNFGICDYQRELIITTILRPDDVFKDIPVFTSLFLAKQEAPLNLTGESYPEDPETWANLLPGPSAVRTEKSMVVTGYVTVHGIVSEDPVGLLGAFWSGTTSDNQYGQWLLGEASPAPDSSGRMIYQIEIRGFNFGDDFVFVQVAEDPRTKELGHVGVGRDEFNFIPGSFLGTPRFPLEIVLLHPPFLEAEIPGQVIQTGGSFDSIDLRSFIVDPTGQDIDFRVTGSDYLFLELDSLDVLHINYPDGWSGVDRISIEATHDTREVTIREASFVVISPDSRFSYWADPAPGWFAHEMKVVAALDPESGVNLDNYPIVAAIIDGQVRAADTGRQVGDDVIFDLDVQANEVGKNVEFALYTVSNDQFVRSPVSFSFTPDAVIGSVQDPVRLGSVVTDIEEGTESLPHELSLNAVYPNPARTTTTVSVNTVAGHDTEIWLTDLLGKRVHVRTLPNRGSGSLKFELDVASFASGVYYLSAETDTHRVVKTLVVVR